MKLLTKIRIRLIKRQLCKRYEMTYQELFGARENPSKDLDNCLEMLCIKRNICYFLKKAGEKFG